MLASDGGEVLAQLVRALAADDVEPPAAKARLHDDGAAPGGRSAPRGDEHGLGMWKARSGQEACRQELVVGGEQRWRAVEDRDPACRELAERPQAGLDAVECLPDATARELSGRAPLQPALTTWTPAVHQIGPPANPKLVPAAWTGSTLAGMKETLEREIKLTPGEGFVLPELGGFRLPTRVFISTYHDSQDLRLARHGVTLRYRVEDGGGAWQLKLPKDAARLELELPGIPARPPRELVALLPAYLRGAALVPVARLRTRREGVRAQGAEIVDDNVAVLQGQHVTRRFREVEVELLDGDERTLRHLEKELRRAGAESTGELQPKLHRALDFAGPVEVRVAGKRTSPGEALGIAFEAEYRALLAHDPGTRRGDDPEDLHQLRVATRRLRAFLRTARPLVDHDWASELRDELGWLGGHLGPARDLDVMLERLRAEVAELGPDARAAAGLIAELEAERAAAYRDVASTLEGDRYFGLLDRLEEAASPPLSGDTTKLAKIFERETKRMRRTFRALGKDPDDDALHASRIAVKRARYAADLAAHELGRPGAEFVSRAKRLQDVLGDHQDAVVARARIRDWATTTSHPGSTVAAERLLELEHQRMVAPRAAWPGVWRKLDDAARRAVG